MARKIRKTVKKKEEKQPDKKRPEKFDTLTVENTVYFTRLPDSFKNRETYKPLNEKELLAFIPGTIQEVKVKKGDHVAIGDRLMTLEAMKMNNAVTSNIEGVIKSVNVVEGDMVKKNQLILEFE
jgi:acetyl/propionyl-CoA carboxylase alpha subunit